MSDLPPSPPGTLTGDEVTDRSVRMLDVAEATGLSRATVSLAMRGHPRIPEATREVVVAAAERLGYVYDRGAAKLRTGRSNVVALVMPDIVNPFVAEVSLGAREVLSAHGLLPVIANTTDDVEDQRQVLQAMVEERVAGIVMIAALGTPSDQLQVVERSGIPVVLLGRRISGRRWPFVGSDDDAIGAVGADHLITHHGCRRVAYVGGNGIATPRVARRQSFGVLARRHRVPLDRRWSAPFDADFLTAHRQASALLADGAPPDGLLCHNDAIAFGVLRALHDHGYGAAACRVIGIDDIAESSIWTPSVSSIAVHPARQGRLCAAELVTAMGFERPAVEPLPQPVISLRESCGCR